MVNLFSSLQLEFFWLTRFLESSNRRNGHTHHPSLCGWCLPATVLVRIFGPGDWKKYLCMDLLISCHILSQVNQSLHIPLSILHSNISSCSTELHLEVDGLFECKKTYRLNTVPRLAKCSHNCSNMKNMQYCVQNLFYHFLYRYENLCNTYIN